MKLPRFNLGVRHLQVLMLFLCLFVNYMLRVNLSIAVVLMTNSTPESDEEVFDWTMAQQSTAQSIFFLSYLCMNFVAAVLVTKVNIKYLLLFTVTVSAAVTLATPVLVTAGGFYALVILRIILGLVQGTILAAIWGVMSKWIPPSERSHCGAMINSGNLAANLVSFAMLRWIGSIYGGWPNIFYFTGAAGALWAVLWAFFGAESPSTCSFISLKEKTYIEKELSISSKNLETPKFLWQAVFCNKACWGIILPSIAMGWGYWTIVSEIPSYFNAVMYFSPTENGLITAMPYAIVWVLSFFSSYLCDKLQSKGVFSASFNRKMNNSIGQYGAALCLIILALTTNKDVAVVVYVIGVTLLGFTSMGYSLNIVDVAPNFAGFLMGIVNGISNMTSLIGPLFAGLVIQNASDVAEWRIVFLVTAAIFVIGNSLFIILGSAKIQDFDRISDDLGVRHLQVLMLFLCLFVNSMLRVNLVIAFVLMTNRTAESNEMVFDWTVDQQAMVLNFFFISYLCMNFVSAVLVTKLNIKYLLLFTVAVSAAVTLATPVLVTARGFHVLFILRIILGLVQGTILAAVWGVMSKWIPPSERSHCGAMISSGNLAANLVSFAVSRWIGSIYGGWPNIFYFTGAAGALWAVLWAFFGAESPSTCSFISLKEKTYIEKELSISSKNPRNTSIPWLAMFFNKACWGIIFPSIAMGWGYWTIMSAIPSYFNTVMNFSPTENGLIRAMSHAIVWVLSFFSSYLCDKLQSKGVFSASFNRKMNNSIGQYGAALCLIILALTTNKDVAVVVYVIGVTLLGFTSMGYSLNIVDVAPNFAGFLMGIVHGISNMASLKGPLFVRRVIQNGSDVAEWRIVFLVTAAIFVIGNSLFIILGSAKIQDFNRISDADDTQNDHEMVSDTCDVSKPV